MNETLILVWAVIAIIGIIAIIVVKWYFKEKEEEPNYTEMTSNPLYEITSEKKDIKERTNPISNIFSRGEEPNINLRKEGTEPEKEFNPYIAPKNEENIPNKNISYSSQNQVLINYDDTVQKFQEPITDNQRDIMSQNTKNTPDVTFKKTTENKHELKDLFTIDELIKESKRKDDEREKESKTIRKETEDNSDIKESIKKNKAAKEESNEAEKAENKDIEDIKSSIEKMHEIAESIKTAGSDDLSSKPTASQKDINEAINTATTENETEKEEVPEISETKSITDAVIKKESEKPEESTVQEVLPIKEENEPSEKENKLPEKENEPSKEENVKNNEIKTPSLKAPTKVEEDSVSILSGADEDYEFGASIDSSNLFEDENGELSDLDYRKDLAKFTNSIKNSSIVKDIRDKLIQEPGDENDLNEEFIRNVNSYTEESNEYYDEYEPIINETHVDYIEPEPDEQLRQENTRKVFNNAKTNATEETTTEESIPPIKEIPEKSSLKVTINNNEEVLRKGDEIIFNHEGESYSSKVYSINGDNIKVRYRRKSITIKPKDIKKIY